MPILTAFVLSAAASAGASDLIAADPHSDAPERRMTPLAEFKDTGSYAQALQAWRNTVTLPRRPR